MTQHWTIINKDTGEVLCPSFITPDAKAHPKDNGWPWDAATQKAVPIDGQPNAGRMKFDGAGWKEDAAAVEAELIAAVKDKNASLVDGVYSAQFGKSKKYSRKNEEYAAFRGLAMTVAAQLSAFTALSSSAQIKSFRYAMAEAEIRGVTIDKVMSRWGKAIDSVEQAVAQWEAIEQKSIDDIRSAKTASAKRAAYEAIDWTWKTATS